MQENVMLELGVRETNFYAPSDVSDDAACEWEERPPYWWRERPWAAVQATNREVQELLSAAKDAVVPFRSLVRIAFLLFGPANCCTQDGCIVWIKERA